MCHPRRAHFVPGLEDALPDAEVVWDEKDDRWDTGRRALLAYDPGASHHLVVQDDAIPCRNLLGACQRIALQAKEHPVALYTGRVRPHQRVVSPGIDYARKRQIPYLAMAGPWWGVGVLIATEHIPALVRWGDHKPHIANYDKRIARWFDLEHIDCWYTVPSLVQHRPVGQNPSLIPRRYGDRQAQWFIGNRDPLRINWLQDAQPLKVKFRYKATGKVVAVYVGSPNWRRFTASRVWTEITT